MTQRKFKHKYLPLVAIKDCDNIYDIYRNREKFYEVSEDLIEGHDEWQEITELVEGRWYKKENIVGRFREKEDCYYCFDDCVSVESGSVLGKMVGRKVSDLKEATTTEIHQALEAIRIEKGLVEGVKIETFNGEVKPIGTAKTRYQKSKDRLFIDIKNDFTSKNIGDNYISERCIYCQGKWATKVEEPILVTEDGYKVGEGEEIKVVFSGDLTYETIKCKSDTTTYPNSCKFFKHSENAQAYIENHKPRFSRAEYEADLNDLSEKVEAEKRRVWTKNELCTFIQNQIQNLKQSK